ncbi:Beta-galactosidase [Cucumis melo var. makuwa]|nr:Beta-galactosidase [Cucumis melo var. makuwa]
MGQPPPLSAQISGQKPIHASPLSGAWAHASLPVNLIAHPIRFYASSPVQPSHPSGHPPPHALHIAVGQQPSKLSNLYSSANLFVDPLQQPFCYRNEANQHHNRLWIEVGEPSAPSGYGQLYVHGLRINHTYRRAVFEVNTSLAQTDLLMYSKNSNLGRTDVKETASTSQLIGPTASRTSSPTLSVIAQSAYTPQQNGVVERKNRHLLEVARSLMFSTSLPSYLWGDAILTAAHLINRMPSRILHLQTPLECLEESYPFTRLVSEVSLCVFGCTAYVHSFGPNQTKFIHRAQACVFVGYPSHHRGYKCFHLPSRKYFVTMDVTFCEDRPYFPVSHLQGESMSEKSNNTFKCIEPTPSTVSDIDPHPIILPTNQVSWKTYYMRNLRKEVGSPTNQPPAPVQDFEPPRDQGMENPIEPCTNNTMSENDRSDAAVLENMEEKNHCNESETLSPQFRAFTASLDSTTIPKNIYIALECPKWKNVIMEEMKALEKNNTWEICALPKGHKPVGYKCMFTLKYKADGTLDRHKARLVAKGFTQIYGVDYSETFSPIAKLNTVRVLLSVAVNKDWPLYQLDVENAFLNGDLVEKVYMSPSPGFEAQFGQQVCKLQKSLYGRKQSPRAWFDRFTSFVKSQGYSQGHSDHTLFTKVFETWKIVVLIVYVDDIVLSGDDHA